MPYNTENITIRTCPTTKPFAQNIRAVTPMRHANKEKTFCCGTNVYDIDTVINEKIHKNHSNFVNCLKTFILSPKKTALVFAYLQRPNDMLTNAFVLPGGSNIFYNDSHKTTFRQEKEGIKQKTVD